MQVVPTLSVPRIRAILHRFRPDDFAPDPLPHGAGTLLQKDARKVHSNLCTEAYWVCCGIQSWSHRSPALVQKLRAARRREHSGSFQFR